MNLGPETELVEHKKTTAEIKEGMASIAAILNKHGHGTLYFGVQKNGDVTGQQVAESTLRNISQAVSTQIEPRIFPVVERMVADDGAEYARVTFAGDETPYACRGVYRIRVADEDVVMTGRELTAFATEHSYLRDPWDQRASSRPVADVDEDVLRKFVERGRARSRIAFDYEGPEDALSRLGLLRNGSLTNAADVLFCPSHDVQLKMGVFASHERIEALDMHQETGTVPELIDRAVYYVANNIRRRLVVTGKPTRDEIPEIPLDAIREAVTNGYAHRTWHTPGYLQIDIYHDAVDIISPGWFIEGQDPESHLDGTSTSSSTRNGLIAQTLFRSGDIESSGMGMRKMKALCDAAGVRFAYEKIPFGTKVTFHRNDPFAGQVSDGVAQGSSARDGSNDASMSSRKVRESSGKFGKVRETSGPALSELEAATIALLEQEGASSTTEVANRIGITGRGAQKLLRRLMDKGIVERTGAGRSTRYKLAD